MEAWKTLFWTQKKNKFQWYFTSVQQLVFCTTMCRSDNNYISFSGMSDTLPANGFENFSEIDEELVKRRSKLR